MNEDKDKRVKCKICGVRVNSYSATRKYCYDCRHDYIKLRIHKRQEALKEYTRRQNKKIK